MLDAYNVYIDHIYVFSVIYTGADIYWSGRQLYYSYKSITPIDETDIVNLKKK